MKVSAKQERKQLLVFGYGFSLIFAVIAFRATTKLGWGVKAYSFSVLALGMLLLMIFNQDTVRVMFKYWMKLMGYVGVVVNTALLVIIYYFVFTPAGLIAKLMGNDLLSRSSEKNPKTYWIKREAKPFDKNRYTQQF